MMIALLAPAILGAALTGALAATVREVTTFQAGVWLENLAVRSNGDLLATRLDKAAEVISINPRTGAQRVLVSFPGAVSAFGIAEVSPEVFAVSTGNYSASTGTTPGSYSMWTLDLRRRRAKAVKVADYPEAGILNGVAKLDSRRVLAADSINGVVYEIDLRTGSSRVVLSGAAYKAPPPPAYQLGVNGIHVHRGALYFINTGAGTLSRVPLRGGKAKVLVEGLEIPDDFTLTASGDAFLTVNVVRSVVHLALPSGNRTQVAGGPDSTDFGTPTAAQFGRTRADRNTLYVVTGGVRDGTGNALSPAKVLAVDVSSFRL